MEFWEIPLCEFFLKLHYFYEEKDRLFREQAELTRLQTVTLVNIQLSSKDKIKDPRRLWRFPWETETKPAATGDIGSLIAVANKEFKKDTENERNK